MVCDTAGWESDQEDLESAIYLLTLEGVEDAYFAKGFMQIVTNNPDSREE